MKANNLYYDCFYHNEVRARARVQVSALKTGLKLVGIAQTCAEERRCMHGLGSAILLSINMERGILRETTDRKIEEVKELDGKMERGKPEKAEPIEEKIDQRERIILHLSVGFW